MFSEQDTLYGADASPQFNLLDTTPSNLLVLFFLWMKHVFWPWPLYSDVFPVRHGCLWSKASTFDLPHNSESHIKCFMPVHKVLAFTKAPWKVTWQRGVTVIQQHSFITAFLYCCCSFSTFLLNVPSLKIRSTFIIHNKSTWKPSNIKHF